MISSTSDIVCGEIGAPDAERWSDPVDLAPADRAAVEALAAGRVLETEPAGRVAGIDYVGVVALPTGRRIRIRSKVPGVVLLDWLAYLNEGPPAAGGEGGGVIDPGADVPRLVALRFLCELETLARHHLRKDYLPTRAAGGPVRGRVLVRALARAVHRLPALPLESRTRDVSTLPNRVLAAALDRLPVLLPDPPAGVPARLAALREVLAGVKSERLEVPAALAACREAAPPGYAAALQLAGVILQGASPDPVGGQGGRAFLLSVAGVWERAVRRMCHDLRDRTGWRPLPAADRTKQWDDGPGLTDPVRRMTADVLLARGGRRRVLDAKYKRGYGAEGRNDRFQVVAYALAFAADRGTLVYPTAEGGAARSRVLLAGDVRGNPVTIESVELPMAAGPAACRAACAGILGDPVATPSAGMMPASPAL